MMFEIKELSRLHNLILNLNDDYLNKSEEENSEAIFSERENSIDEFIKIASVICKKCPSYFYNDFRDKKAKKSKLITQEYKE